MALAPRGGWKRIVFGLIAITGLPILAFIGYGLSQDRDVANGLKYLPSFFGLGAAPPAGETGATTATLPVRWRGRLQDLALTEASGLARSHLAPGVLWALNDSGNASELFALSTSGEALGRWPVAGVKNVDWEDLTSFQLDGVSYLAIADIGDNFRWRQELAVHIVAEPDVRTEAPSDVPLTVAWTIRYEYPDGPHDAESIAVDVDSQELLVLTKRSVPVQMFQLPLRPVADVVTATHLLDVLLPQPSPLDLQQDPDFGAFRSMPTGMDAGAAGVVIVTPLDAYYWPRIEEESVAALLAQPPRRVPLPRMSQIESVCFDATGRSFFITSERRKGIDIADLFEVMID